MWEKTHTNTGRLNVGNSQHRLQGHLQIAFQLFCTVQHSISNDFKCHQKNHQTCKKHVKSWKLSLICVFIYFLLTNDFNLQSTNSSLLLIYQNEMFIKYCVTILNVTENCWSPRWCWCLCLASTTSYSLPCHIQRCMGFHGWSKCITRCSQTPSR